MIGHRKINFVERSVLEIAKVCGVQVAKGEWYKTSVRLGERGRADIVTVFHRILEMSALLMNSRTNTVREIEVNR